MTLEEVLNSAEVKALIDSNPHLKGPIERAAEMLHDDEKPVESLLEAARAIIDRKIRVFFSYKKQDEGTARLIVKQLQKAAGDKLEIIFAGDFTRDVVGEEWNKKIRKSIKNAHWFILLLPDPSVDWDWCLFETGMFRGKMLSDKVNRLFCLHHPDQSDLPPQIQEFQATEANSEAVQALLRKIFIDENPMPGMKPINTHIEEDIPEMAKKIVEVIKPPIPEVKLKYCQRSITIKPDHSRDIREPEALNSAEIIKIDPLTLAIFGKMSKPKTWGDLITRVVEPGSNNRWLDELRNVLSEASGEDELPPINATFHGRQGGKMWHTLLLGVNKPVGSDAIESFVIAFTPALSSGSRTHLPIPLQALLTNMKYCYRFRWEILERFKDGIKKEEVDEFRDMLEQIENEAQSRGVMNPEELCKNFDETDARMINDMFAAWYALRNPTNPGELDIAMEQKDTEKIQKIMAQLKALSNQFISLATRRMEELTKK